jgi:hypothetical protein
VISNKGKTVDANYLVDVVAKKVEHGIELKVFGKFIQFAVGLAFNVVTTGVDPGNQIKAIF